MYLILPLFVLLSILVIYLTSVILRRIRHFTLFQKLGIPGPRPNIVTGNMSQLRSSSRSLMDVMTSWESAYGPIYGYFIGLRPILVIRDLDTIKEILIKNSKSCMDRPIPVINAVPIPDTLVGLRGNRWKEVRGMLSPAFSSVKMKSMVPIMNQSVGTTLDILSKSWTEIDVYRLFQGVTCDVISGCALAMKVQSQTDQNDKFLKTIQGFLQNAYSPFVKVALCFPVVARLAEWGLRAFGHSHEMTRMIIASVKTAMDLRRRGKVTKKVDVLQLMLDSGGGLSCKDNVKPLSDEEIVANAWVFILGGFETTAAHLTFTAYLLGNDEGVQDRLFKEIEGSFGEDEIPTYEQVQDLKYLDQVVSESLRLYPPVVSFVIRKVDEDVEIGSYKIPRGVNVQIPVWQIHHDPELWPQPDHFDPERFSPSSRKAHHSMSYIPFGAGPRSCIGSRFAQLETKITLARIIRKFKILPAERPVTKIRFTVPTVSMVPIDKILLRFEPRK